MHPSSPSVADIAAAAVWLQVTDSHLKDSHLTDFCVGCI